MFEGFDVLTKAQVVQLLKEFEQVAQEARQEGIKTGKEFAAQEAFNAGYEQGHADATTEFDAFDAFDEGYAEGYNDGYEDGRNTAADLAKA